MKHLTLFAILIISLVLIQCKDDKPVKEQLVIWQTESDPNARQILNEIKSDFEKTHKNVEVSIILNSWGAQASKLTKAIKTNTLPDIAHIQPFMMMSLVDKLETLDDVYKSLEKTNGKMFDVAKEVTLHNGTNYGIPYALGTTSWSYNTTKCIKGFGNAKNWKEFIANAEASKKENKDFSIMLPGASSFFMEQLYIELLANNGGKMFNSKGVPLFDSKKNIETLQFFRTLKDKNLLHPNWKNETYLDQFTQLAEGKTSCVLVTYARASNTIKSVLSREGNEKMANDSIYAWMNQPIGPSNNSGSIATIDCEPWVIFKNDKSSEKHLELCKEFLLTFYKKENYIKFTKQVPIHLTPIFVDFSKDTAYTNSINHWKSWNDATMNYLLKKDSLDVRPILMPDNTNIGKSWSFLLELQYLKTLSKNITRTLTTDDEIIDIANSMQAEIVDFLSATKPKINE